MTEKELLQYRLYIKEIEDLENRMKKMENNATNVVAGTVKASRKEFPYTEYRVSVQMEDPKQVQIKNKLIADYKQQIAKLLSEQKRIEDFVQQIEDPELRLVFRLRYIDGLKQWEIADRIHLDRSRVSRKISKYLTQPSSYSVSNAGSMQQ